MATEIFNGDTDYKEGDLFLYPCQHENCKRTLLMRVVYSSTMQCWVPAYKESFDMRNYLWYCKQHR